MKKKITFEVCRRDKGEHHDLLESMLGGSKDSIEEAKAAIKEYEKQGRSKKAGWVVIKTTKEYFEE